jgi:hypothetical protein
VRIPDGFGVIVKFEREGMIATVELDEGRSHRSVPLSQLNNVPPKESNKVRISPHFSCFMSCVSIDVTHSVKQGAKAFVIEGSGQVHHNMLVVTTNKVGLKSFSGSHCHD